MQSVGPALMPFCLALFIVFKQLFILGYCVLTSGGRRGLEPLLLHPRLDELRKLIRSARSSPPGSYERKSGNGA